MLLALFDVLAVWFVGWVCYLVVRLIVLVRCCLFFVGYWYLTCCFVGWFVARWLVVSFGFWVVDVFCVCFVCFVVLIYCLCFGFVMWLDLLLVCQVCEFLFWLSLLFVDFCCVLV